MSVEIIPNLPFLEYCELDAVNWSSLRYMDQTPFHYKAQLNGEMKKSSNALRKGNAYHDMMENIEAFEAVFKLAPSGSRASGKGCAEWLEFYDKKAPEDAKLKEIQAYLKELDANCGLVLVNEQELDELYVMRKNTLAHTGAGYLIDGSEAECTIIWTDEKTGIKCKARLDLPNLEKRTFSDYKTARDVSTDGFEKSVWNYQYYGQMGMYDIAFEQAFGFRADHVNLIAVENVAPFAVRAFALDGAIVDAGRKHVRRLLDRLAVCQFEDDWPAYGNEIEPLSVPPWAEKRLENLGLL